MACAAAPLVAQNRLKAANAAAFLKEPAGLRLGSLVSGVIYPTGRTNSGHIETTIDGWIPAASATASTRDGFDLTVTAGNGEAVRASPSGAIIARVQEGTLMSKVGTRGSWVRVRRAGWVPRGALERPDQVVASAPPTTRPDPQVTAPPPAPPPPPPPTAPAVTPPATLPASPTPGRSTDSARRSDASGTEMVSSRGTLRKGTALAATPEGAPIGSIDEVDVRVLERQRDWTKVGLEAWVRTKDLAVEVDAVPRVSGTMVRDNPERFVGQTVGWRLQYLSIQTADDLRPEMPKGQAYALARGPLPEGGFVYLMLTKAQADDFRARAPLDEVMVEAVIRAGRTRYLPTPVLELVKLIGK